jgi:hypothetical protein
MALPSSKTYNLTIDPDALISASGGNKQKLLQMVQADQSKLVPATIAAKKIDDIRMAAQVEQAPQQTVFQKLFNLPPLPASPGGLGAIAPQGGGMPAPQGMQMASAAPMPPQGGMPASPAGLGAMPPVGMAAGGMTELPDSYGLESLPIPDSMYNEQSFSGGGIVAFAKGGDTDMPDFASYVAGLDPAIEYFNKKMPAYDTTAREEFLKYYAPERLAKQKDQSIGLALFAAAAEGLNSKDSSALGAIGAGMKAATPMLSEAYKSQRADELDALKARAAFSSEDYTRQLKGLEGGQALFGAYRTEAQKAADRAAELERVGISAGATKYAADVGARSKVDPTGDYFENKLGAALANATPEQLKNPKWLADTRARISEETMAASGRSDPAMRYAEAAKATLVSQLGEIEKRKLEGLAALDPKAKEAFEKKKAQDALNVYRIFGPSAGIAPPPELYQAAGVLPKSGTPTAAPAAAPAATPTPAANAGQGRTVKLGVIEVPKR